MTQVIFTRPDRTQLKPNVTVVDSQLILSTLLPAEIVDDPEVAVQVQVAHTAPLTVIDDLVIAGRLHVIISAQNEHLVTYRWQHLSSEYAKVERYLSVIAAHPGGRVNATCVCKTTGSEQILLHTEQAHTASHTQSTLAIRGVSQDTSRVTVKSEVCIFEGIAGVQAHQVHKHLLLDKGARAVSEPILEVLSDDVKCSHGAAIRYLDAQQLFYLRSRGYSEAQARETLVNAFLTV